MFERFTEKARRVIFFARYEAIELAISQIEAETLLLALLRESSDILLACSISGLNQEALRARVRSRSSGKKFPTSADMPLSDEARHVLTYAMKEADRLGIHHISE